MLKPRPSLDPLLGPSLGTPLLESLSILLTDLHGQVLSRLGLADVAIDDIEAHLVHEQIYTPKDWQTRCAAAAAALRCRGASLMLLPLPPFRRSAAQRWKRRDSFAKSSAHCPCALTLCTVPVRCPLAAGTTSRRARPSG